MQYQTCPHCGANLDFGERCDCQKKEPPAVSDKAAMKETLKAGARLTGVSLESGEAFTIR